MLQSRTSTPRNSYMLLQWQAISATPASKQDLYSLSKLRSRTSTP